MLGSPPTGLSIYEEAQVQREPAWKQAVLKGLAERVNAKEQRMTQGGLSRLCAAHLMYAESSCSAKVDKRRRDEVVSSAADFGSESKYVWRCTSEKGTCGICLGIGDVLRVCHGCSGL